MTRCPSCKAENAVGKVCRLCGAPLPQSSHMETIQYDPSAADVPSAAARPVSIEIGSLFAERYRVDELLGRGGMGSVYRVYDTVEKEDRALKVLHEGFGEKDGADRFLREIEILSRIHHPSVLRVYAWGGQDTQLYFVSEYVAGRDLKTSMGMRSTQWPPEEAARLVADVAEGLAEAHKQKIIHRDLKPQNIILCDNGSVKLLDFGIARGRAEGMHTLTKTGMILGTPEYMSPEQLEGKKVEPPSDVYALGIILYQMLTGNLPFSGNMMEVVIRVLTESVKPPRLLRGDVPVWLDRIVMKCLQRDIKKRYPTAVELAEDLKRPRQPGKPKMTWLQGGDGVLEDPAGAWDWDLVLSSSKERPEWTVGIGLRFSDLIYMLRKADPPTDAMRRWTYYFSYFPANEVIRRLINYEPPI